MVSAPPVSVTPLAFQHLMLLGFDYRQDYSQSQMLILFYTTFSPESLKCNTNKMFQMVFIGSAQ